MVSSIGYLIILYINFMTSTVLNMILFKVLDIQDAKKNKKAKD